jgi:hypothetical protein
MTAVMTWNFALSFRLFAKYMYYYSFYFITFIAFPFEQIIFQPHVYQIKYKISRVSQNFQLALRTKNINKSGMENAASSVSPIYTHNEGTITIILFTA